MTSKYEEIREMESKAKEQAYCLLVLHTEKEAREIVDFNLKLTNGAEFWRCVDYQLTVIINARTVTQQADRRTHIQYQHNLYGEEVRGR